MKRKAQFFIITAVLLAGALLLITNVLTSSSDLDYTEVVERHDIAIMQNMVDEVSGAWWDGDWPYRIAVSIAERNGDYLTQYPVPIILSAKNENVLEDCGDIRIVHENNVHAWLNTTSCDIDTYHSSTDAVARYKLDEGAGIWANDSTGNGHNGQLSGNPSWVTGRYGSGLEFDGSDDYVEIPSSTELQGGSDAVFTVMAWFRPDTIPADQGLVTKKDSTSQGDWGLFVPESCPAWATCIGSAPFVGYYGEAGGSDYGLFYGPVQPDEWQHAAFVLDQPNDNLYLYYNGEQVAKDENTGAISAATSSPVEIGGMTYSGDYFDGRIDDVRIHDYVLQSDQMKGVHQNGIGLNVSINMTPQQEKDLFIHYGNVFTFRPNYSLSRFNPVPLTNPPVVTRTGPSRTKEEIDARREATITAFNDELGGGRTIDFNPRGDECDILTMRSASVVLRREIC